LAEEALISEPVSVRVSLLSGKIQGTFVDQPQKAELGSIFAHVNHRVVGNSLRIGTGNFSELIGNLTRSAGNARRIH
jgi:hypothetical protein